MFPFFVLIHRIPLPFLAIVDGSPLPFSATVEPLNLVCLRRACPFWTEGLLLYLPDLVEVV